MHHATDSPPTGDGQPDRGTTGAGFLSYDYTRGRVSGRPTQTGGQRPTTGRPTGTGTGTGHGATRDRGQGQPDGGTTDRNDPRQPRHPDGHRKSEKTRKRELLGAFGSFWGCISVYSVIIGYNRGCFWVSVGVSYG